MTTTQLLTAISMVGLVACGTGREEGPPLSEDPPSEQDMDEMSKAVATVLDRQLDPEDGIAATTTALAVGETPKWLSPGTGVTGGVYVGTLLGLHFDVSIDCANAAGAVACGPAATRGAATFDIGGELSLFGWTGSFDVSTDATLSGLGGPTLVLESNANIELGSQFTEWFRQVTHQTTFSIDAGGTITIDRATALPLSGGGHFTLEYLRTSSEQGTQGHWRFDVETIVSAGIVTYTINGVRYRLDLRTGQVTKL